VRARLIRALDGSLFLKRNIYTYSVSEVGEKFMVYFKFNRKLSAYLHALLPLDYYFARGVAAMTAALQIWDHGSRIYRIQKMYAAGAEFFVNTTYMTMHLRIASALLVSSICLWFRRAIAFYVSGLALAWVIYEYIGWYLTSRSALKNAELARWPSEYPHAFNIGGATGWNIAILLLTIVLFVWHIKTLIGMFSSNSSKL
jgi:hypothetical protein